MRGVRDRQGMNTSGADLLCGFLGCGPRDCLRTHAASPDAIAVTVFLGSVVITREHLFCTAAIFLWIYLVS